MGKRWEVNHDKRPRQQTHLPTHPLYHFIFDLSTKSGCTKMHALNTRMP